MNTYYIITNALKDPKLERTLQIKKYLEENGKVCYVQSSVNHSSETHKYTDPSLIPDDVECVLVLGGDGTLLQASRDLIERQIPLLGINMGTLGYLAEIEAASVKEALDQLMNGSFTIENRMMLGGTVRHQQKQMISDIALNDIVIYRRGHLRVVDFQVYVDGTFLCSFSADGIIISTPPGSTGYSLSAGGPIVSPDASLILLTAISPHTLNSRPIVLPDHVSIEIGLGQRTAGQTDVAEVIFDGDTSMIVQPGDRIRAARSQSVTRLVKINHTSFVEMLRKKMN